MKDISLFPVSGYLGPEYFCDREKEIKSLNNHIRGHVPCVIIGIRRLGKTGLIRHFFHQSKQEGIFVDLQGTDSLNGLIGKLAQGITETFPEKNYTKLWETLKGLRPQISFDPFTGTPQIGFDIQKFDDGKLTLRALLNLIQSQKRKVVIAFDEFQQILAYPDKTVEGLLRSEMQSFPTINYIFSGSQTHLLARMFQEGSRPFFSNVAKLYLDYLNADVYASFIQEKYAEIKKTISFDSVKNIIEWTDCHTYYTQYLCNQLSLCKSRNITNSEIEKEKYRILQTSKQDYFLIRDLLTRGQWKLLIAVAKEQFLFQPNSKFIIRKYNLDTPAAVTKAINTLLNKQLINLFHNENGQKYYKLADIFLLRFIQSYL